MQQFVYRFVDDPTSVRARDPGNAGIGVAIRAWAVVHDLHEVLGAPVEVPMADEKRDYGLSLEVVLELGDGVSVVDFKAKLAALCSRRAVLAQLVD